MLRDTFRASTRFAVDGKKLAPYLAAALLVALTTGAAAVFQRLPHANLPLLFLTVVLVIAARWGLWPSIFASVLSFFSLNFFFTQPYYTLVVEEEGDVATLLLFLVMAGITGKLAARMRSEMANNRAALGRVSALLDFSRRMAGAPSTQQALQALVDRLSVTCNAAAVALQPVEDGGVRVEARAGGGEIDIEAAAAAWQAVLQERALELPGWTALPLAAGDGPVGLAAVRRDVLGADQRALAVGFCDQAAIAVERAALVDSLRNAQLESESEQLRAALLSSVSHDLRTPLVSIIGSTTSLLEYREVLKPEARRELLTTVLEESQRLNRYIQNLLDMTRFGRQPFDLRLEWVDLNDLVSSAAERLGSALARLKLSVDVAPEVALLKVHGALIEQVIVNILDNATNYAPAGSTLEIDAFARTGNIVIDITNEGPTIPSEEREKIFEMFHRVELGDGQQPGTGLGLAICRSIITAHGGSIVALTRPGGTGAVFRITLPSGTSPAEEIDGDEHPDHRRRRTDPKVSAHQP